MLEGVEGNKLVYFITDGNPTSGGVDPVRDGISAGQSLRRHVDNLTFNAIFLGSNDPSAIGILEKLTGQRDRVRKADSADQLDKEILKFPSIELDAQTAISTLETSSEVVQIKLAEIGKKPLENDVWTYETTPFKLFGKKGDVVENTVKTSIRGVDGSVHISTVILRYKK